MSDTSGSPITPFTPSTVPAADNSLKRAFDDTSIRLMAGAEGRALLRTGLTATQGRVTVLEAKPDLTPRVSALEARAPVPGPKGDTGSIGPAGKDSIIPGPAGKDGAVGATGPASTVPGPAGASITGPAGKDGTNANLVAATLTTLGSIKTNVALIQRTTTPISVNVAGGIIAAASLLPSVSVSVPGVALGDFVTTSFAAAPPTGLTISAAQVTAADTGLVKFAATQAVTLVTGARMLHFCWVR